MRGGQLPSVLDAGLDGLRRGELRLGRNLRVGDQLMQLIRTAFAQQNDRVRIAVDDALEEVLAVVVSRQCALSPAASVVEDDREIRVSVAEEFADFTLHALGKSWARASGADRDRQRTATCDRRKDEVAERRN